MLFNREGIVHAAISNKKRRAAFTLAEVLITLGIIGVVAAMTMPVLIQNFQKQVLTSRAKKAYSTLSNAFYKTLVDLEFSNNCFYQANSGQNYTNADCKIFLDTLVTNLRVIKDCKSKALSGGCITDKYKDRGEVLKENNPDMPDDDIQGNLANGCYFSKNAMNNQYRVLVLNDGLTIFLTTGGAGGVSYFGVDTNGFQGPNRWGYDLFILSTSYQDLKKLNIYEDLGCVTIEKGGKKFFDWLTEKD